MGKIYYLYVLFSNLGGLDKFHTEIMELISERGLTLQFPQEYV